MIEEAKPQEGGLEDAPQLGSLEKNPKLKWYVVHTQTMCEEKAKSTLLDRIRVNKLEGKFGEIVVPKTATETVLKSGKKKKVERNAFPGYIIIEMEMDEGTNHLVRETPKITGFVGNQ